MDNTLQSYLRNPRNDTERTIAGLGPWFHNLHLPDGTQTAPDHPLGDFPSFKWAVIEPFIPKNLAGWSVLDIGCNAGFYSFEMARRGAQVTAIDVDPRYLKQAQWAALQFGLHDQISFEQMQVYDLARSGGRFDLVLFLGVLYHLRYPLLGVDAVTRATRKMLVMQTLILPGEEISSNTDKLSFDDLERMTAPEWPKLAFIEHKMEDDPTNWWVPNHGCVEAMLRSSGMRVLQHPAEGIYVCGLQAGSPALDDTQDEFRAAAGLDHSPR